VKVLKDGGYELAEVLLLFTNLQILDLDGNVIHFQCFSLFETFWTFQLWKIKYLSHN